MDFAYTAEDGVAPAQVKVRSGGAKEGRPSGVRLIVEAASGGGQDPNESKDAAPVGESHFQSATPMSVHQGSSVSFRGTTMHVLMLQSMLLMAVSFWMYSIGTSLVRVRAIILERESRTQWVRALRGA